MLNALASTINLFTDIIAKCANKPQKQQKIAGTQNTSDQKA